MKRILRIIQHLHVIQVCACADMIMSKRELAVLSTQGTAYAGIDRIFDLQECQRVWECTGNWSCGYD